MWCIADSLQPTLTHASHLDLESQQMHTKGVMRALTICWLQELLATTAVSRQLQPPFTRSGTVHSGHG